MLVLLAEAAAAAGDEAFVVIAEAALAVGLDWEWLDEAADSVWDSGSSEGDLQALKNKGSTIIANEIDEICSHVDSRRFKCLDNSGSKKCPLLYALIKLSRNGF